MSVMSVSLPESLLEEIETKVEEHGYSGRSDLTRKALREFLRDFSSDPKLSGDVLATVTVVLDEESVEKDVTSLRHDFRESIIDRTHSCIGEDRCMEVLVLEADVDDVDEILGELRSIDGVVSTEYTANAVDEVTE